MSYYGNPENKYLDYFLEQKANGRIKPPRLFLPQRRLKLT